MPVSCRKPFQWKGWLLISYIPVDAIIQIPNKSSQWCHGVIFEKQMPTSKANFNFKDCFFRQDQVNLLV